MEAHHLLSRIDSLQRALSALAISVEARYTDSIDEPIKEQTPPDDDWSPNGFAAFHLEYLATSMHRLADELVIVTQRPSDLPSDPLSDPSSESDVELENPDGWKPETRALGHLDYIITFLDQVTIAIETDSK